MTCPYCRRKLTVDELAAHLTPDELRTLWGKHRAAQRQAPTGGARPGAGRPRSDAERCPCGATTLARAQARGKSPDHKPTCTYFRAA